MKIYIITSSYPAHSNDPKEAAGLFVRDFAIELSNQKNSVVISPIGRKLKYDPDPGITIAPISWDGGEEPLASASLLNPISIINILKMFIKGRQFTIQICHQYHFDRVLCLWALPSGLFGFWIFKALGIPYDIWALGSDIWKIKKIPIVGKWLLNKIFNSADRLFADGIQLCKDVEKLTTKKCIFLPSCRKMPSPSAGLLPLEPINKVHLLYVGRYHPNKGPDILIEAIRMMPDKARKKISLHMFGIGAMELQLRQMIDRYRLNSIIKLNGPIDIQELSNYLSRVSALIIPSRIESIPVIFSDALQLGTPVITTPVGDLADLVNNLRCGLASKDTESPSLTKATIKFIEYGRLQSINSRVKIKEIFQVNNSVKRYLKNYRMIIEK